MPTKPIREQLREQAEAIRREWAKGPSPDGSPRVGAITLEFGWPVLPMTAIRNYCGRVNSDLTYAPEGCLLLRGGRTERTTDMDDRGVVIGGQRVVINIEYRDYPWNYLVLVATTTSLPAGKPMFLVDPTSPPIYQVADFNEWLDALEPPCGGTSSAPDEPSPEPGSWRTRPSQL